MKEFIILLSSLSETSVLMNIIKIRNTPFTEIKDERLKSFKRSIMLEQDSSNFDETLKTFGEMLMRRK